MDTKTLIGLSEQEAVDQIKKASLRVRIVERDEEKYMGTCDFWQNRINLVIKEGKVVSANIG